MRKLSQINWQSHYALVAASHNPYLIKTVEYLKDHFALLRGVQSMPEERPPVAFQEHSKVLAAIRKRDPVAAEAAARAHVKQAEMAHLQQMWPVDRPAKPGKDGV